jgi:hypothetical protein
MCQQRKTIKVALSSLRALGEIILDDDIDDVALRPKLFAAVPRDKLQEQVAGLHDWVAISGFRPLIHERTQAAADRFPQTAAVRSVLESGRTGRRIPLCIWLSS